MEKNYWRKKSKFIIQQVINNFLEEEGLKSLMEISYDQRQKLRRKISEAYPFGERKYYPYKEWLAEVSFLLARVYENTRIEAKQRKKGISPGQLSLFDSDETF